MRLCCLSITSILHQVVRCETQPACSQSLQSETEIDSACQARGPTTVFIPRVGFL
ncbi:hypothetical protein CONLIGDRAFT_631269 [Coniochaeta ligniaria NRRL 30616]|uniref:Uncharacterized protein n=1 Tax=Coniochaeta ligniaria NRRL 30616 TaxID=1408157 RepID=A0A1J7IV26_9PEZI|nr:hypothetical protein CONLIGDRAFT_631269 [Coniochaeta ligniaria NRRL 30616]